ncbi:MAG: hypothetical protein H6814_09000 [Phycisphaeraceae bacterium]|nr:hypothetical protein [Phycisphaeraceae bacterium]
MASSNVAFWRTLDLGGVYEQHWLAVDSVLYLLFFTGIAQVTLGRRFEGRGGQALVIVVGVALAIGASAAARTSGYRLGALGPIAWAILLLVLGGVVYELLRMFSAPRALAGGLSLLAVFVAASSVGSAVETLLIALGITAGVGAIGVLGVVFVIGWAVWRAGPRDHRWLRDPHNRALSDESHIGLGAPVDLSIADDRRKTLEVLRTLKQLRRHFDDHPPDARSEQMLFELAGVKRRVDEHYERVLQDLARRGWRTTRDHSRLPEQLRAVLLACRENGSRFREAVRVAQAGHDANNPALVVEAVDRLIRLEKESVRLTGTLGHALRELAASNQWDDAGGRDR